MESEAQPLTCHTSLFLLDLGAGRDGDANCSTNGLVSLRCEFYGLQAPGFAHSRNEFCNGLHGLFCIVPSCHLNGVLVHTKTWYLIHRFSVLYQHMHRCLQRRVAVARNRPDTPQNKLAHAQTLMFNVSLPRSRAGKKVPFPWIMQVCSNLCSTQLCVCVNAHMLVKISTEICIRKVCLIGCLTQYTGCGCYA